MTGGRCRMSLVAKFSLIWSRVSTPKQAATSRSANHLSAA